MLDRETIDWKEKESGIRGPEGLLSEVVVTQDSLCSSGQAEMEGKKWTETFWMESGIF